MLVRGYLISQCVRLSTYHGVRKCSGVFSYHLPDYQGRQVALDSASSLVKWVKCQGWPCSQECKVPRGFISLPTQSPRNIKHPQHTSAVICVSPVPSTAPGAFFSASCCAAVNCITKTLGDHSCLLHTILARRPLYQEQDSGTATTEVPLFAAGLHTGGVTGSHS